MLRFLIFGRFTDWPRAGLLSAACQSLICLGLLFGIGLRAQEFSISNIFVGSETRITYPSQPEFYFVLFKGESPIELDRAVDLALGMTGVGEVSDRESGGGVAFYRVGKVPVSQPLDMDHDGLGDLVELWHADFLDPLDPDDADLDYDGDGVSNKAELLGESMTDPADPVLADLTLTTFDNFTIVASLGVPGLTTPKLPAG